MVQDSTTRRLDTILNHLATSYDPLAPSFPKKQTGDAKSQTTFLLTEKETGNSWVLPGPVLAKDGQSGTPTTFAVIPGSPNTNSLTVLDNRTNRLYTVPIENNAVKALEFKKITAETGGSRAEDETDRGLRVYDPAFQNTAVCKSRITYIDGDAGILRYRGYPIEELSEKSTYLEVAYLLLFGELPTKKQFKIFNDEVMHHTFLHVQLGEITKRFNYDAHPMGLFVSGVAAMSTFHPEANPALAGQDVFKKDVRQLNKQIFRLLGKVPTLAAMSYRHRIGREYVAPRSDLSYTENFLFMLDHLGQSNYKPNPVLVKALDVLFILHADHELNCSTAAMRHIGSSMVDPYTAVSGAAAALYGPLHGGANEAVLRMLEEIGTVENVPKFLEDVRNRKKKLSGFGHRVYKNYDPRAKIISKIAKEVFEVTGREPLIQVAEALEKAALADEFFVKRKLYPNVDFFSGIIYKAMGMPLDYFPVLFAIPRVSGWLAHWKEQLADADQKIWRPRQLYDGSGARSYVPMESRDKQYEHDMSMPAHKMGKRTMLASYDSKEGGKRGEE